MYCQILARHMRFLGGISLIIDSEREISFNLPLEKIIIFNVENIADSILEANNKTPKSSIPALILGL